MPNFDPLFCKSTKCPVAYRGKSLWRLDRIKVKNKQVLRIIFESVNSEYRQGIAFDTDDTFGVAGQLFKRMIVLWSDTAPSESEITVYTKTNECRVKNVWDHGDGVMRSWHSGAAMIMEDLPNGRRYRCNDGYPDDDFDDLVFRIEWRASE